MGLGYVGLSLAAGFGQHFPTVGFDVNSQRVEELRCANDRNGELPQEALQQPLLTFSCELSDLDRCGLLVVAVPTPLDERKRPDLSYLESACQMLGQVLRRQGAPVGWAPTVVVFESTVFPGCTEDFCIPLLQSASGLRSGIDFKVGFSPERVNPGDAQHSRADVVKVVSAQDRETLDVIVQAYRPLVPAGLYEAPDIRIAEAAKLAENIHRDVSIALMNEFSMAFSAIGLDTREVLKAAQTKWNFPTLEPGLVGGDCIPVSPMYLAYKAQESGFSPELLLTGRWINDGMARFVALQIAKRLEEAGTVAPDARVLILGVTFKENVRDCRNTRVGDLARELEAFGVEVSAHDPLVSSDQIIQMGLCPVDDPFAAPHRYDGVVLAVAHRQFRCIDSLRYAALCGRDGRRGVLVDLKDVLPRQQVEGEGTLYWRP